MRETTQALAAFEAYWGLGDKRSFSSLSRQLGKSTELIGRWSSAHGWQERVKARILEEAAAIEAEKIKQIASMKTRMVKQGIAAQIKASRELERLADAQRLGAMAAVQWLDKGVHMELRGLDLPETVTQQQVTGADGIAPLTITLVDGRNGSSDKDPSQL